MSKRSSPSTNNLSMSLPCALIEPSFCTSIPGIFFKISSIVKIEIPRKATGHGREEAKMCFEDFSIEEMN